MIDNHIGAAPVLFRVRSQRAKDFVHARRTINDLQQTLFLKVVHFVLSTQRLDLTDRRSLGNEFGNRVIDYQQFKNSGSPEITTPLTLGTDLRLALRTFLNGWRAIEVFDLVRGEIQLLQRGGVGLKSFFAFRTQDPHQTLIQNRDEDIGN
jgi:hypothetical protein